MNTKYTYDKIDFGKYFERYMAREDAIHSLPSPEELKELAWKAIVKDHLVLHLLPEGTKAEIGDTLTLKTVSQLPKFNKEKVSVSIGRGLYDKGLEEALVGKQVGDSVSVLVKEQKVTATVLEMKRKVAPAPTDEMVQALQAKDHQNKLITTVAEYEAFVAEDKVLSALAEINYYTMTPLLEDHPIADYDESDIVALGKLEREAFRSLFLKESGIDVETATPEQMKELLNVNTMDEFIALRREWYQMKIHQCYTYLNILGLPCEGKTDPLDHYEVLSELQMMMFEKIKNMLAERKN